SRPQSGLRRDYRRIEPVAPPQSRRLPDGASGRGRQAARRTLVCDQGEPVMVARYLEDFRRAVAEMEQAKAAKQPVTHDEVYEVTKLLPDSSPLTSLTSLTSYLSTLERRCPPYIESHRWQQCIDDGRRFVADWGSQATALGWTVDNLFGLHVPP